MLHVDDDRRFWGTACKANVFIDRLYAAFMKIYFFGFQPETCAWNLVQNVVMI